MSKKLYVSFDIESDGSLPKANMWEIGIVAYTEDGNELDTYSSLISTRPGIVGNQDTIQWIESQGLTAKYQQCVNQEAPSPATVMNEIAEMMRKWNSDGYKVQWVARPSSFDFPYIKEYFVEYGPQDQDSQKLLPFKATCISSMLDMVHILVKTPEDKKQELWDALSEGHVHTHDALDDARGQGKVFMNLIKYFSAKKSDNSVMYILTGTWVATFSLGFLAGSFWKNIWE